jgi:hypothetical protein
MTATETASQTFGFANVKQPCGAMSYGIESRTRWNAGKVSIEGFALLKRDRCQDVENLAGFLLKVFGHVRLGAIAVSLSYKAIALSSQKAIPLSILKKSDRLGFRNRVFA